MLEVNVIKGTAIASPTLSLINESTKNTFGDPPLLIENESDSVFFTIMFDGKLVATGRLHPVNHVTFDDKQYSILAIGGILANEKGKGYGRQIMNAISRYLSKENKTGIGFCIPENRVFYEKCGFGINTKSVKQFRFPKELGKEFLNDDDCIIYQEGEDRLLTKVSLSPEKTITCPCHPW